MSSFRRNLERACCNSRSPDPVPVGPQKLPVCHLDAVPVQVSAIIGYGPDDGDEKNDPYAAIKIISYCTMFTSRCRSSVPIG